MKKHVIITLLFVFGTTLAANAQCANDNTIVGATITPPCPGSTSNNCIQGGQYVTVNVVAGNTYTFSTCTGTTFDTQITTYPTLGGASIGFSDDACGGGFFGLQSSVTWIATYTGQIDVLVDQYDCADNTTCGTLTIACSTPPPPLTNDDPCGAIPLTVNTNCVMGTYSTTGAGNTAGVPAPGCGGYSGGDVWFSAVVPTSGVLDIETGQIDFTDSGMALYTATSCTGPFSLVECDDDDGTGNMSLLNFTGLTPGSTVYIRVWEFLNNDDGAFNICASSPVPPAGDCVYTLNMADSWGDGWGGSQVCVTVTPGGTTCYTVTGAANTVLVGVNIGDLVTISYTAAGGFQGEISYSLTLNGGPLFSDGPTPSTGSVYTGVVDCITPPAPPQDCVGGLTICSNQTFAGNSSGTGAIVDLTTSNQGCLSSSEQQGNWYYFSPSVGGDIGLTISPQNGADDYDFALWGPMASVSCPPSGPPVRCSYSDDPGDTGMNDVAIDFSETWAGDKWVSELTNVQVGEVYIMYIDNWSTSGQPFDLNWDLTNGASLDCTVLPVELLTFTVDNLETENRLNWATATEHNSDNFELQRSIDGIEFQSIAQIVAAGTSSSTMNYSYLDEKPKNGVNYYRLKQTDLDGSFTYSTIVSTTNRLGDLTVRDPFQLENGDLNLEVYSTQPGSLIFELFDLTGRRIVEQHAGFGSGSIHITIPINRPAIGTYIYRVTDQNGGTLRSSRIHIRGEGR